MKHVKRARKTLKRRVHHRSKLAAVKDKKLRYGHRISRDRYEYDLKR
jgi:hypothetical protein